MSNSPKKNKYAYAKSVLTKTEQMNNEESREKIKQALQNYVQIDRDDIKDLGNGIHLRYFSYDNKGVRKFRLGGFIYKNMYPKYVILSNSRGVRWSVQIKNTIFFRRMKNDEIQKEYEELLKSREAKIEKLKKQVQKLKEENHRLKTIKTS